MAESRSAPEWLVIARREFLERVRTSWFVVVTLLGPLGMLGIILVPAYLSARSADEEVRFQVVDRTGKGVGEGVAALAGERSRLKVEVVAADTAEEALRARIRGKEVRGYLVLPDNLLSGGVAVYSGENATNMRFVLELRELISDSVRGIRAAEAGLGPEQVELLQRPIGFYAMHTTGGASETSAMTSFVVGYAVMFILYMAILLYAVNVMRSVVQEKTSRVVELIVSATRPRSLMLGKLIGVGGVGLFQLSIWAAVALLLIRFRRHLLGLFGIDGDGFAIPVLTGGDVTLILAYFVLGYFFYAAIYAAVGAMTSSDQEAQQAQTPVMILLIIPALCVQVVANDPRGSVAEVLTLIPFSSPILMPMRYLLDGASALDVALSLAILLASLAAAIFLAARIYRVGILSVGKRPTLRELARWIRDR